MKAFAILIGRCWSEVFRARPAWSGKICSGSTARFSVIKARGLSSAGSAANAVIDTVFSLTNDTPGNDWHSVAVCSDGSYDVEKGLISSFPIRVRGGKWEIAQGVPINDFSRAKIDASVAELKEVKSLVSELIS